MKEEWRPVPGWRGGYEVSSLGRVKSLDRRVRLQRGGKWIWQQRRGKILTGWPTQKRGYLVVTLSFRGKRKTMVMVSHIVAAAFLGPRPKGLLVCHGNGKPSDNKASNLYYGTDKTNMADRDRHGRTQRGEGHYRAILTKRDVREIRAVYKGRADRFKLGHVSQKDLMAKYGIGRTTLQHLLAGRTWKGV